MPTDPSPRLTARDRAMRRDRIFARLLEGQSAAAIAAEEGVTARRVRQIVRDSLERWDADPAQDYAGVQIARLESALRLIEQKIAAGDIKAIDRLVKVLDQLDKYQSDRLQVDDPQIEEDYREAAFIGRLERLAASRAAVAARFAASAAIGKTPRLSETPPAAKSPPDEANAPTESAAGKENNP